MVVRHREQRRLVFTGRLQQRIKDRPLVCGIEVAGWLVGEQTRGPGDQGATDRHPLSFTMAELIDAPLEIVPNPHATRQSGRSIPHLRIKAQATESIGKQDVLEDVEVLQQSEFLEYEPDTSEAKIPPRSFRTLRKGDALKMNFPGIGNLDAGRQPQDRGLSASRRPDHRNRFTPIDSQRGQPHVESRHSSLRGVGKFNLGKFDHVRLDSSAIVPNMLRILTIGMLLVLFGCDQAGTEPVTPTKKMVVAVNHPVAMFARQIGKNRVDVVMPVPADQAPAYWRPGPEDIAKIQQADLILLNGADFARWTGTASLPSDRTVVTSDRNRDQWIEYESAGHSHGPGEAHTHTHVATYTWLDPDIALNQAQSVRDALTNAMPEYQDEFRSNFALIRRFILEESARLETVVNADKKKPVFLSSPNYFYLQRRFGINGHAFEWDADHMPEEDQWTAMQTVLETHPAEWMIWEREPTPEIAERLRSMGIESVVIDPADTKPEKGDLIDAMRRNADTLARVYDYEE